MPGEATLDHVFVLVPVDAPAHREALASAGWIPTYTRVHPGQGTANVCYACDDAFLELLWIADEREARGPPGDRLQLAERWHGGCPLGIAWRGALDVPTWAYRPAYLPPHLPIAVAHASDDPAQPLFFQSPGKDAPRDWPPERRGALQRALGRTQLDPVLTLPPTASAETRAILAALGVRTVSGERWGLAVGGVQLTGSGVQRSRSIQV
jgi:hypothetical protein